MDFQRENCQNSSKPGKSFLRTVKQSRDALEFRIDHLERVRRHGITVAQLVDEMLEAKRRDGRSEVYLRDLRNRLNKFAQDFGHRPITGITVDELDNWLRALPYSPQSRTNYRTIIGVLFSYARQPGNHRKKSDLTHRKTKTR